jgi:hypothetical protein
VTTESPESPEPADRRPWGSAIAALMLVVVIVVVVLTLIALVTGSGPAISLDAGECLRAPEDEQIVDVDTVPCSEPHELEVVGTVELDGDDYPGDEPVFRQALVKCEEPFASYVGVDYERSIWVLNVFTPSDQGWDAGDRTATCLVFQFAEDLDYLLVTGSARGSGV